MTRCPPRLAAGRPPGPPRARRGLLAAALGALPLAAPATSRAAAPGRAARILIGFPPGGSSDIVARLYAERLRGRYAPALVVESRSGAAGRMALAAVRDAEADGATILQTPASILTLQPHADPAAIGTEPLAGLRPVSTVCTYPFAFAVPAGHPARDFAALVAWLRAQGGEVPFASPAAGSSPHFLGVMLAGAIGARLTHVPYRGAAPAVQDLLAGRIPLFCGVLADVAPQHGAGLRILAVSSAARLPRLPEVPTLAELGHPGLTKEEWFGLLLPAATAEATVRALHAAVAEAAADPGLGAALARLDFAAAASASPEAFAAALLAERDAWGPVVRRSGFRPDA